MIENVMPVLGFYYDHENFYIFLPFKKSMFQFLHNSQDGKKIQYEDKIKLIK